MKFVEGLETRTLLSASLAGGVLTVTGTAGDDNITIRMGRDETTGARVLQVRESLRIDDDAVVPGTPEPEPVVTSFDPALVTSIVVNAGDGNDHITLRGNKRSPFNFDARLNGENGNDRIRGGGGADVINGGAGNDRLEGGDGNDVLNGDAGNDHLIGGRGADVLNGGDNDPLTNADGTRNRRAGDSAVADSSDTVGADVESVRTQNGKGKGLGLGKVGK